MRIRLEWKLADLWVGVYWARRNLGELHVWICLVPCLPVHVWWLSRGVLPLPKQPPVIKSSPGGEPT